MWERKIKIEELEEENKRRRRTHLPDERNKEWRRVDEKKEFGIKRYHVCGIKIQ